MPLTPEGRKQMEDAGRAAIHGELAAWEAAMRHPRPWSIGETDNFIRDANGDPVADIGGNSQRADATGRFIVAIINATLDTLAKHKETTT